MVLPKKSFQKRVSIGFHPLDAVSRKRLAALYRLFLDLRRQFKRTLSAENFQSAAEKHFDFRAQRTGILVDISLSDIGLTKGNAASRKLRRKVKDEMAAAETILYAAAKSKIPKDVFRQMVVQHSAAVKEILTEDLGAESAIHFFRSLNARKKQARNFVRHLKHLDGHRN